MKYRLFGSAGIKVSEMGMGCWAIGGNKFGNSYGTTDDAESIIAVKKALSMGCNFFDTADVYGHGHSEELLGTSLATVREMVHIATKVGGSYMYNDERWGRVNFTPEYIAFALENSLKRIRTSYIDVYQLHNPPFHLIKEGEIFRLLRILQKKGKIRHVGISVHTLEEGLAALDFVDSIQCVFNILYPNNYELMETAKRRNVAVIVREPLLNGLVPGKYKPNHVFEGGDIRQRMPEDYKKSIMDIVEEIRKKFSHREASLAQIALKYILSFDSVSVVIPGAKNANQVEENLKASEIPDLTKDELSVFGS